MKPLRKANSIILSLTAAFVFSAWVSYNTFISTHPNIKIIIDNNKILSVLFGVLISVGFYNIILFFFTVLFNKVQFIKKVVLGSEYLEGVWIGFFIGKGGRTRIFYEVIEQDLDNIVIRGTSFNDDGSYHASWVTNSVVFNTELGKVNYYYENDAVSNSHINPGIGSFNVKRNSQHDSPIELIGYTSDLFSTEKISSIEKKVKIDKDYSIKDIIFEGRKIEQEYNEQISKGK